MQTRPRLQTKPPGPSDKKPQTPTPKTRANECKKRVIASPDAKEKH